MTIAIVATFAAVPATASARAAVRPVATSELNSKAGFAGILLGQPAAATEPLAEDDLPSSDSEMVAPEANPIGTDPQTLAALGLPSPPFPPPRQEDNFSQTLMAVRQDAAASQAIATARPTPAEYLPTTTPAALATVVHDRHASDPGPAAATLPAAAGQAAKFAVANFTAPLAEPAPANEPEPGLATSTLSTLAAPLAHPANDSAELPPGIPTPLRDPSWAGDFGQKLLWFVGNEKQSAQLTLHPPQLGSIEITLNLDQDGANAHFVSANAEVRGTLEAAVPRLREMFASAGIALGQVSVGNESFRPPPDGQRQPAHQPRPLADNAILGSDSASRLTSALFVTQRGQGMIDTFA